MCLETISVILMVYCSRTIFAPYADKLVVVFRNVFEVIIAATAHVYCRASTSKSVLFVYLCPPRTNVETTIMS